MICLVAKGNDFYGFVMYEMHLAAILFGQ